MSDNENDSQSEFAQISKADLQALRAIEKSHKKLEADHANLQREVTISKAGLTELGDIQRKALLAVIGDQDLTPEVVQETAKALGFTKPEPAPAPDPQQALVEQFNQQIAASDPLAQYRQATSTAPQTGTPPRDWASEIDSADSPEALQRVIQQAGIQATYD